MAKKVVILGGGVAGMSAAHELVERGFQVTVLERKQHPGGKARSLPVPYSERTTVGGVYLGRKVANRRKDLPAEHGFRFFPGFYKHVVDTMKRIPYQTVQGNLQTVADNLVGTRRMMLARFGRPAVEVPCRFPRSLEDIRTVVSDFGALFGPELGVSWEEKTFFAERIWQILTSCAERRLGEYEKIGWWDFVGAAERSVDYQKLFALGITRSLVASQADRASTRTIGDIFVQLLLNIVEPGVSADRVLNGPTSLVWLHPWHDYLATRGVVFQFETRVLSINQRRGRLRSVTVERQRRVWEVEGDYYVAALPVEVMAGLLTDELLAVDPDLANIFPLSQNVAWMNGIQFYLSHEVPITPGHVIYVDSPWALTSISQRQFWTEFDLGRTANHRIADVLSVDVSDWQSPGLNGKAARNCTRDEIRTEVWAQLKRSLNVGDRDLLRDEWLYDYFLDPDINPVLRSNGEPLLVNLIDSWRLRPEASTRIPNFFLAADYIRTHTDLATMESANEAARRAVNGILQDAGVAAPPCRLWNLHEPEILKPLRALDQVRYRRGLPWDGNPLGAVTSALSTEAPAAAIPAGPVASSMAAGQVIEQVLSHLRGLIFRPETLAPLLDLIGRWRQGGGTLAWNGLPDELQRLAEGIAAKLAPGDAGWKVVLDFLKTAGAMAGAGGPEATGLAPDEARQVPPPAGSTEPPKGQVRFVQP